LLIGLLLAGQHTSSTTSAWLGFFLAKDKALQERCHAQQRAVCGDGMRPDFDQARRISHIISARRITTKINDHTEYSSVTDDDVTTKTSFLSNMNTN